METDTWQDTNRFWEGQNKDKGSKHKYITIQKTRLQGSKNKKIKTRGTVPEGYIQKLELVTKTQNTKKYT